MKGYLQKHRGKAFSIIRGQFQKRLIEKIRSDSEGGISEQSVNSLLLIPVIEKYVLSQIEGMYPFVSMYKQEHMLYTFHQNDLTNDQ